MEEEGKWQNGGEMSPVWHQFSILQDSQTFIDLILPLHLREKVKCIAFLFK